MTSKSRHLVSWSPDDTPRAVKHGCGMIPKIANRIYAHYLVVMMIHMMCARLMCTWQPISMDNQLAYLPPTTEQKTIPLGESLNPFLTALSTHESLLPLVAPSPYLSSSYRSLNSLGMNLHVPKCLAWKRILARYIPDSFWGKTEDILVRLKDGMCLQKRQRKPTWPV